MAQIAMAAAAAGTVLSMIGQIQAGNAANKAAKLEADQMDVNAGQQRAVAQRQAINDRHAGRLAESSLQARAAASGGGASDPTVVGLAENIDAQSEYNALTSLYSGEEKARGLEGEAEMRRYEGRQAKKAATIGAISSVLSSAGSMGMKYGGSGPNYNTSTGSMGAPTTGSGSSKIYWN